MSDGTVITGGVVSLNTIVTWNDALPVLPWASVAVHVTVVVPTGKFEPEAGVHVGVIGPSTVSLAVAVNVSTFPDADPVLSVMSAGTVTVGGVVSCTVTWKEALLEFPAASLAVQLTVVVPSGNVDPDAGVQFELVTPTASVNVTE
jgi:hypothetical protein